MRISAPVLLAVVACNGAAQTASEVPARENEPAMEVETPAEAEPAAETATEAAVDHRTRAAVTAYGRLPTATHRDLPPSAPGFAIHVPAGFDAAAPFAIVVFLHGWSGCVRGLMEPDEAACLDGDAPGPAWGLSRVHDAAGTNSVLVVPQLRWLARSGSPGAYRVSGTFATLLEHAFAAARDAGAPALTPEAASGVVLAAHSAGFETALAILDARDHADRVDRVLLLDSLYRGTEGFARWVRGDEGRRLVSLYTGDQSTYQESQRLAQITERTLGADAVARGPDEPLAAMATHRVVVAPTRIPHGAIPRLSLPELLRAFGLPER